MVTINLTILIELILFLVFLWGTQRFILTPVLKNMDERNDSIERDVELDKENSQQSEELELKYRHEIAVIRRAADDKIRMARQKTLQEHAEFLLKERRNAEGAVAEVRSEVLAHVATQRDAVLASVPELAQLMETQLTAGTEPARDGGAQ